MKSFLANVRNKTWLKERNYLGHLTAFLRDRRLYEAQRELFGIWRRQLREWDGPVYVSGWFYQSLPALGILGWRDTAKRIEIYGLRDVIRPGLRVLDVGANCGFLSLTLARGVDAEFQCVELNPFLCEIGAAAAARLDVENVRFFTGGFESFETGREFDVILSLACHRAHGTRLDFQVFFSKLCSRLATGGTLVFESHNGEHWVDEYKKTLEIIEEALTVETELTFDSPEHTFDYRTPHERHFLRATKE